MLKFLSLSQGFWLCGADGGAGPEIALTINREVHKALQSGKHLKRDANRDEVYAEPGEVDRLAAEATAERRRAKQRVVDGVIDQLLACNGVRAEMQAVLESLDITWWADGQNV